MLAAVRCSIISVALALGACGGSAPSPAYGTTHAPRERRGMQLSLRTHDGEILELGDQRGSPVLLFLFATYDGASLAAARGVSRFTRDALDTVVIAVAVQPDAETFAAAYVESQSPPYTVAYEPAPRILMGVTDLGAVDSIPTLVMIDAHGREVARHTGYVSERVLAEWRREAVSRGGVVEPAEPQVTPPPPVRRPPPPRPRSPDDEPELEEGDLIIEPE